MITKEQIVALKNEVHIYATQLGGSVVNISYRKNGRYARGYISVYCLNVNIGEIRAYPDGNVIALNIPRSRRTSPSIISHKIVDRIRFLNPIGENYDQQDQAP